MADQEIDDIEKPKEDEDELFILDDIRVDTLGLVEQGAVDEVFFLLKNQEGAMADTDTDQEAEQTNDETTLTPLEQLGAERLKALVVLGKATEEMDKATKIGTFLRQQREKKKLTIQEVAEELPITADTVKALENGDHLPSKAVLGGFAKVLGVPANILENMLPSSSGGVSKASDKKKKRPVHKNLSPGAARGVRSLLSTYGDELPENVLGVLAALIDDSDALTEGKQETQKDQKEVKNNMAQEEEVKKPDQSEVTKTDQQPPPATSPPPEAAPEPNPVLVELAARLEKSEETHAATITRLEKAETLLVKAQGEARQEREARQRIVHIEKAREFSALGVNADEMGGHLHRLSMADDTVNVEKAADAEDRSDMYGYFTGVLKAASAQIIETGFFQEAGSSNGAQNGSTATLLEKAEAAVAAGTYPDLAEALIHATPEEGQAYINQVRNKGGAA